MPVAECRRPRVRRAAPRCALIIDIDIAHVHCTCMMLCRRYMPITARDGRARLPAVMPRGHSPEPYFFARKPDLSKQAFRSFRSADRPSQGGRAGKSWHLSTPATRQSVECSARRAPSPRPWLGGVAQHAEEQLLRLLKEGRAEIPGKAARKQVSAPSQLRSARLCVRCSSRWASHPGPCASKFAVAHVLIPTGTLVRAQNVHGRYRHHKGDQVAWDRQSIPIYGVCQRCYDQLVRQAIAARRGVAAQSRGIARASPQSGAALTGVEEELPQIQAAQASCRLVRIRGPAAPCSFHCPRLALRMDSHQRRAVGV